MSSETCNFCQHGQLASATAVFYLDKMFSGSSKMSVYRLYLGGTGRFLFSKALSVVSFVELREIIDHKFDLMETFL